MAPSPVLETAPHPQEIKREVPKTELSVIPLDSSLWMALKYAILDRSSKNYRNLRFLDKGIEEGLSIRKVHIQDVIGILSLNEQKYLKQFTVDALSQNKEDQKFSLDKGSKIPVLRSDLRLTTGVVLYSEINEDRSMCIVGILDNGKFKLKILDNKKLQISEYFFGKNEIFIKVKIVTEKILSRISYVNKSIREFTLRLVLHECHKTFKTMSNRNPEATDYTLTNAQIDLIVNEIVTRVDQITTQGLYHSNPSTAEV